MAGSSGSLAVVHQAVVVVALRECHEMPIQV